METKDAIDLARKIIELDLLRDQMWESFAAAAGDEAYEILRNVQNN
ncbi:hypothetical protein [Cytobacillus oceanisediminis]|uniref:Uncharacterized protein n=1 Tax=Cytobacillus oceanisediminis TaxID=665099 RepID=A0A562JDN6_9BACI|nr:hypothetical protein [Cytobacillus oceanisediminis]TWH81267.1 hypothetical protein IQ19_04310 [Cytobacillus oceanisediminis]